MGRESHGHDPTVVHSSIALLQERFRQLQRVKEMREERELLRMLSSESKQQFITNNSDLRPTTSTTTISFSYQPELMMTTRTPSPPPPPPPPPHSHVSLSLWPSSSSEPPRETLPSVAATFPEPDETSPLVSMTLWRNNAYDYCDVSDSDSGVDTSLHL